MTNFNEFKKLFFKIPKERLEFVSFISLRPNAKIPVGLWKEEQNWLNYYQVKDKMKTGWNIGVVAKDKGILMLDLDCDEIGALVASASILERIPQTFAVQTRSGGLHYYFLNDGEYDTQNFKVNGILMGELRANWSYVVAPGSDIDEKQYKVIKDVPLAKFEGDFIKFFEKNNGNHKEAIPQLYGKKGKPISEKYKAMVNQKEQNKERTKEIMAMLKR